MSENHQLVFRIMRLAPPKLDLSSGLKLDLEHDMICDNERSRGFSKKLDPLSEPAPAKYRDRVDLASSLGGLSGTLAFPQTFGPIYLGQTFSAAVTLCNMHETVSLVGIKVGK